MNFSTNIFKFLFGYGIFVFPLLLLVGPLISEVYLILLIIFSSYYIYKDNKFDFYLNKFVIFYYFFTFLL